MRDGARSGLELDTTTRPDKRLCLKSWRSKSMTDDAIILGVYISMIDARMKSIPRDEHVLRFKLNLSYVSDQDDKGINQRHTARR
jgi:hypothetical protein